MQQIRNLCYNYDVVVIIIIEDFMQAKNVFDYYKKVIDSGVNLLKNPEEALVVLEKIKDVIPDEIRNASRYVEANTGYNDRREGWKPFNQSVAEKHVHRAMERIFYIEAILSKFPMLERFVSVSHVEKIIRLWQDCHDIIRRIKDDNSVTQYDAKTRILAQFTVAYIHSNQL